MKRKRISVHKSPWTPFERRPVSREHDAYKVNIGGAPTAMYVNSRYQVALWEEFHTELGPYVHLSIKDHDRSTRHDWRDFQRIKNEIVGPEYEAVEVYPAESRLVDTCNQYHLFVFAAWKVPFGFSDRLVADESPSDYAKNAKQRPFEPGSRPADCLNGVELDAKAKKVMDARV